MSKQTFKVSGITTHGTSTKVRFTDDLARRVKQFSKGGATRIDLMELPSEMTKLEALKFLAAHRDFQSPADQSLISDCIADREKDATKGQVKVKTSKKTKPSNIKSRAKKVSGDVKMALASTEVKDDGVVA